MSDEKQMEITSRPVKLARPTAGGGDTVRHRWANRGAAEQDVSSRFFLTVFTHWWKVLVPVTILLMVGSTALVMHLFEPQYRASAWLQIRGSQPYVAFPEKEAGDRDATKKYLQTQIELLRSPLILGRVMRIPEIAEMPELQRKRDKVEWLARKGLMIAPKGDSELLEIAYAGPDPESAARLVDEVVKAYFDLRIETRNDQARSVIAHLEQEKIRRAEEIRMLQTELRQLQKQLVSSDPAQAASAFAEGGIVISENPLKDIQGNMARAQVDHKVLEAQVAALADADSSVTAVPEVLVQREIDQRPEIQEVLSELSRKRALLNQTASASAEAADNRRYNRVEQEIRQLESALQSLREAARPQVREEMEVTGGIGTTPGIGSTQDPVGNAKADRPEYERELRGTRGRLESVGWSDDGPAIQTGRIATKQQVLDIISQRVAQLTTEMSAPARVEPIQNAVAPKTPEEDLPWKLLLVALAGSLGLPFGLCALWERSVRRVTSADQLQQDTAPPVVGEIARLPARSSTTMQNANRGNGYQLSLFEESIDSLRTGLFLAHEPEDMRVLAVSSAVSGEGKSSVAAQLAVSLARSSGQATLVDRR